MGFLLTSVFFFFGMSQRKNIAVQRDTAAIMNARMYVNSYADYLESQSDTLTDPTNVDFDGIIGTVTKKVESIHGVADLGAKMTYKFDGTIFVEWNKCEKNLKGDLVVNGVTYEHDIDECASNVDGYDDIIGPITVPNPFTVETLNAPFYFQIAGNDIKDNKWHLELSTSLRYSKKIKVERVFD